MLILTRRAGESIFLTDTRTGELIGEIKVVSFHKPTGLSLVARLGFDCPEYIDILRDNAKTTTAEGD